MAGDPAGQDETDRRFMAAAIRLSRKHQGRTSTNPSVGTLIVRDDGGGPHVVGSGVTAIGGRPHAETEALAEAGARAIGATAYVTLEPCAHHGRTPPCANCAGCGRRQARGGSRQRSRSSRFGQRVCDPACCRHRGGGTGSRRRSRRPNGRLPDSVSEETPRSDSQACAFQRWHDRSVGRGPGGHHWSGRPAAGSFDAGGG
jgi:hypothetical protein